MGSPRGRLRLFVCACLAASLAVPLFAQSSTGSIQGVVTDAQGGIMPGVTVTIRNTDTNATRTLVTDSQGRYRLPNLQPGPYELTAELTGFAKLVRSGLTLALNQDAVVDVSMKTAAMTETVTVVGDAALLNTTTPEVGVRFDTKRIAELPVASQRDVFSLALSAAGVSGINSGQSSFAAGPDFATNGMRARSNNFMIDGQDSNDPSVTGRQQPINNTDSVSEIRLVTNQFAAEYGRAAGSVMNVVTKGGTNTFHGSGFWFANRDQWNSRSNLDKAAGLKEAPLRKEDQWGGTLGGPVIKDKTFFFLAYQRWKDKAKGSGQTLNGAPTEAGRAILQSVAGNRPQIAALLKFLPAAQAPIGRNASFVLNGQTYVIPLGSITGSADSFYDDHQATARIDHHFNADHNLSLRYLINDDESGGTGQVTPAGLTTLSPARQQSYAGWLTSMLSSRVVNEFRVSLSRLKTVTSADDESSLEIPSLEIGELGLTGFNAGPTRTAIGLAVNLPQFRNNDLWQVQESLALLRGNHNFKVGFDVRRIEVESFFNPTLRGRLSYPTLAAVRGRRGRGGHDQQAPGRRLGDRQLLVERHVFLRAGRVEGAPQPHPHAGRALRAAGQLDRQPRGAEPGHRERGGW